MGFLNYDGPLMTALRKIGSILIANFLFLLCCIPVFTIGPSIAGLCTVARGMPRGDWPPVIRSFFLHRFYNEKASDIPNQRSWGHRRKRIPYSALAAPQPCSRSACAASEKRRGDRSLPELYGTNILSLLRINQSIYYGVILPQAPAKSKT